jgi:hypothetical protein
MAESYLQHAEHYFRIMAAAQAQQAQYAAQNPNAVVNGQQQQYRPPNGAGDQPYVQPQPGAPQTSAPSFSLTENQEEGDDDEGDEGDTTE